MFRTLCLAAGAVLLVAMLPAGLVAQGHLNVAVGLSPESTYDSAGINNINLVSGALTVGPVPLGPRYSGIVDAQLGPAGGQVPCVS